MEPAAYGDGRDPQRAAAPDAMILPAAAPAVNAPSGAHQRGSSAGCHPVGGCGRLCPAGRPSGAGRRLPEREEKLPGERRPARFVLVLEVHDCTEPPEETRAE